MFYVNKLLTNHCDKINWGLPVLSRRPAVVSGVCGRDSVGGRVLQCHSEYQEANNMDDLRQVPSIL